MWLGSRLRTSGQPLQAGSASEVLPASGGSFAFGGEAWQARAHGDGRVGQGAGHRVPTGLCS